MRYLFILIGFLILIVSVDAQQEQVDSVQKITGIEVTASRMEKYSVGQKIRPLDSLALLQSKNLNLGEILSINSSLQINTHSHNGLSSVSFRGTSVAQTGLFWNGFLLSPPNHGQVDLSLIPGGYFNSVKVYSGGGSSLYGNSNIGGSIHLGNEAIFLKHLTADLRLNAGSFDEYGLQAGLSFSNGKWFLKSSVLGKSAQNDFPYTDLSGDEQQLENAALQQLGFMQDVYFRFNKHWILGGSFWYQQNDKQIPATLTSKPSDASQFDNSYRGFITVRRYLKDGKVSFKTGLFKDDSHFQDPDTTESIAIDSKIITGKSISELQLEKRVFKNSLINTGANFTFEQGESEYYENVETRKQLGLYALWAQDIPSIQWKVNLNLRQDFIENYSVPFTPSLGLSGKVYKIVSAKLNVSRNFRVPTFNDQFWVPGGNKNLEPEHSWNQEASLIFNMEMKKMKNWTEMTFTLYNSLVDNWILWVPDGLYWSAQNIQKVWSRGFEVDYQSEFQFNDLKIRFVGSYTYAKSTNEQKQSEADPTYQKQLIYVPEHRAYFTGSLVFSGYIISYNQAYTGVRYITSDNTESLPAFTIGNIFLRKRILLKNNHMDIGFDVFNVWNTDYQVVSYNPMPGTNFKISIKYSFNKKNNSENEIP